MEGKDGWQGYAEREGWGKRSRCLAAAGGSGGLAGVPAGGASCRRHCDEILVSVHRQIHFYFSNGDEISECIVGSAWRGPGSGGRGWGPQESLAPHAGDTR